MPTKAPPTPPLCVWDRNASPLRTVEPRSSDNDECSIDADITSPCSAVSWRNLTAVRGGCAVSIRAPAQCFALQIQADYPVSLQYDASGTILIVFNVSGGISPLGSQSSAIFVDGSDAVLTAGFVVGHGFPTAFKSLFSLSAVPCSLLPAGIPTQPPRTNPVPTTTTTTTVPTDSITTLIPPTCTPVSIVLPPSPMTVTTCRVALPGNSAMPCFTGVWNSPVEFGNTCEISYQSLESGSGTQCLRIDLFARFDSATPGLFADRFGELTAVVAENAPMSHRTLDLVGTATTFNLYARSAPTDASVPFNVAFTVFNCSNVPATTTWAAPDTDTTVATEPDYDTTTAPTSTEWVIGDTTLTAMSNWWLTTSTRWWTVTPSRSTRHTRKTQPLTDRPDSPNEDPTGANGHELDEDNSWIWITATAVSVSLLVIAAVVVVVCVVVRRRRAAMVPSFLIRPPPGAPPPTRFVIV